jgi:hypothetical protein
MEGGSAAQRRSERVLLRIPIEVRGTGADGKAFVEETHTLVLNRHGARVALRNGVVPGARVTITNLQNRMRASFRVVEKAKKSLGDGSEWGVECLDPEENFWGIVFPKKPSAPAEAVDALLECAECGARELAPLSLEEYRGMAGGSPLERDCAECGRATRWRFGFTEGEDEAASPPDLPAPEAAAASAERRRARRLTLKVPVRVRTRDGREEISRTENVSKTGVCFGANLALKEGERISLTVGYAPGSMEMEMPAEVVWRRELGGAGPALYGARLL